MSRPWGSTWIALVGWQAGALKLTARDRWIGWSQEQKLRRLHLVTQNSRFLILPGFQAPNLASRVLGLSLRRLSADMLEAHGYPVLVAETFVDPARFAGTCYRAANWRSLGLTGGYARRPGATPDWRHHGQPKEILVFELQANAGAALRQSGEGARLAEPGQNRATGGAPAAQPVRVPGRRAGVPSRTGQALQPVHGARAGGRGAASRLPRRDGLWGGYEVVDT